MSNPTFSPFEAIGFGWRTFKAHKKFWIIATVLMFTLGSGASNFGSDFSLEDFTGSSETTSTESDYLQFNEDDFMLEYPTEEQSTEPRLPFVPESVSNVLGVTDSQDDEVPAFAIGLLLLVFLAFAIPYVILSVLISGALQMGFIQFLLSAVRGERPRYETILSEIKLRKSYKFMLVGVLYMLLVVVGLICLVLPGIYFAIKYFYASYAVVDRNAGIRESFRISGELTKGNKWNLLLLGILTLLLNILGAFALLYGILVSVPVTALANMYVYNKLSQHRATGSHKSEPQLAA